MPPELVIQLFQLFAPIVGSVVKAWKDKHSGQEPTSEQVIAEFIGNIDKYLAEGAAWRAAHPDA